MTEENATRKVVVNRCFGGFGLSTEVQRRLVGQCEHIELLEPREYYGNSEDWEQRFMADQSRGELSCLGVLVHDGKIVYDEHRDDAARDCAKMVAVVEEIGVERASAQLARLEIVEIPADVEWTIEEYDGREWVSEAHRTW